VAPLPVHQNSTFQFPGTLVTSRSDAENVLQQTCLTAWKNRDKFDPRGANLRLGPVYARMMK
jgi:DNA-directed RNA polymerase specialized sigma24 family protein